MQAGFSDYRGDIVEILAEGDKVAVRTQWSGTQDGPFLGLPPSGNKVRFATADFFRIANGKDRRALGRGLQPAARRRAGPGAAAQDADRDRAAQAALRGAPRGEIAVERDSGVDLTDTLGPNIIKPSRRGDK